jgi:hypothetical protein
MIPSVIKEQFEYLVRFYPDLQLSDQKSIKIEGTILMRKQYKEVPLIEEYTIRIEISKEYPKNLPKVYETSSKIPKGFNHINYDGSLCLGVENELYLKFEKNPTLLYFIDELVCGYLYSAKFFDKFGVYPIGERSHGPAGVLESYKERFNLNNDNNVLSMLDAIIKTNIYRGHAPCPCGSGLKIRNCKHKHVLIEALSSKQKEIFRADYNELMEYFIKRDLIKRNLMKW